AVRYLDYDISEKLIEYDVVIFIDTAVNIKYPISIYKINLENFNINYLNKSSSHHLTIENLILYTKKLYYKLPEIFVIAIKGFNFEYTSKISKTAKYNLKLAKKALNKIINYIINKI
ncbi:MAG: hypothetical protein ACPL1F_03920, partial [bacterium]